MCSSIRPTRQQPRSWQIVTLALTWLGACGGGDTDGEGAADAAAATVDISGRYDSVEMLSGPCGAPTPDALAPPTLRVDSLQSTYYVRSCQTLDDSDCPSIYYDFTVPIENGWAAEGGSAFFSAQCTLSWERSKATLLNETLTVHTFRYEHISDVPQEECTLEAAAALEAPCANETILTATRVARRR